MQAIEISKDAENVVFIKMRLSAQIEKDDSGRYVVYCPALDLCTQGQTIKEARHNITEAIELFFESCLARGTMGEALTKRGFAKFGEKLARRGRSVAKTEIKGRQISVPAQIPLMAYC